ncbi:signal peptidase I [Hydrogenoanaerobacterium saccharovorans]|uniref:Signal peptidase I n=1 Tax=Hydrogenoanaerobacterium saccharovorans TaxID=474960 RepID=A0A1H7Z6P0_9FIRM|nr:signal peptidase I [Hydrogenoanaerobacterium saccharovorans]RPF48812.1 signal peptidase I [Hydrogenoanaerobacterium saccharovorans]SEM53674.1 signal peptidase I [Hydrogenoanaerobacterium saccharovorans]
MNEWEENTSEYEQKNNRLFVKNAFEWVESIAFAVITVVLIFTFLFRVVGVEGKSMEPTLHDGNFIVISDLFFQPKNNDVVVITPTTSLDIPIVKRVIATGGQTVDIDFKKGIVYVDGKALDEPYIAEPTNLYYDIVFPQTVPEGYIFVMGDNRNHSLDSRDSTIGMVDMRYVLGKALVRILPVTQIGIIR